MRRTRLFIIACMMILLVAFLGGMTFAWIGDNGMTSPIGITAHLHKSYFESGDGSAEYVLDGNGNIVQSETGPFEIKYPIQLYYLAWLQKLGYFNADEDNDGEIDQQFHFYLSADLDMSEDNFVLPPIGTQENPFIGTFDGQGHMIYNLTIGNNNSNVTDPPEGGDLSGVEIIGLFGVVGPLEGQTFTYVTSENEIKDLYIANVNVKTSNTNALIGIAAGYVNATVSGVGVINSSIEFTGSHTALTYTENLSDYSLIGYCTDDYKDNVNAERIELSAIREREYDVTEEEAGDAWGGSINMQELYTRLYNIHNSTTTNNSYVYDRQIVKEGDTIVGNNATLTGTAYTYSSQKAGSFVFSYSRGDFMYLHGGTTQTVAHRTQGSSISGYTISSGTHYLMTDGKNLYDASAADATIWTINNNRVSTKIGNTTYYLYYSRTSNGYYQYTYNLTVSTTNNQWSSATRNGNNCTIYASVSSGWNSTNYYVTYYNNAWTMRNSNTTLTATSKTGYTYNYTYDASTVDYSGTNNTYFPLLTEDNSNDVSNKNTGYVISGSNDRTTSSTYPAKSGDIRVSKYGTGDITNSYSNRKISKVYTIGSDGKTAQITNESAYEKLAASKAILESTISSGDIYGLHFMSGEISMSNIVTASYALINGDEYYNYQFPANSIDFTIPQKGKINFFAGTYFSNNNSFFSLHEIHRDNNHNITTIKEIIEIYGTDDPGDPYIYKYGDNTWSATKTSDYSLLFATSRIKKQSSITNKAVYYFEIPANEGEYALGSVSGGTGAYLMYLDLSANKQKVIRTEVIETWQDEKITSEIPNGVAIVEEKGDTINEIKSATVVLPAGTTGQTTISRTDDAVTYTDTTGAIAGFVGNGITANGETGGSGKETILTERMTYYDYNTTTKVTKIVVTTTIITTDASGNTTRTSSQTIDGVTNSEYVDDNHEVTLGDPIARWYYYDRTDATVTTTFGYDYQTAPTVYNITIASDNDLTVYAQSLDNTYTIKLNNTAISSTETDYDVSGNGD